MLNDLDEQCDLIPDGKDIMRVSWFIVVESEDNETAFELLEAVNYIVWRRELVNENSDRSMLVGLVNFKRTTRISKIKSLIPGLMLAGPSKKENHSAISYFKFQTCCVLAGPWYVGDIGDAVIAPTVASRVSHEDVIRSELTILSKLVDEGYSKLEIYSMYPVISRSWEGYLDAYIAESGTKRRNKR
jgi:hypothetical protein